MKQFKLDPKDPEAFPYISALVFMGEFNGRAFGRFDSVVELNKYVEWLAVNKKPVTSKYVSDYPNKFLRIPDDG